MVTLILISLLQQRFSLPEPQAEDTLYDSESMRHFALMNLLSNTVPDKTTIRNFRYLLEAHQRRRAGHHYRTAALQAERKAVDGLWRSGQIADEVHRPLQQLLDHEEAMLLAAPPPAED